MVTMYSLEEVVPGLVVCVTCMYCHVPVPVNSVFVAFPLLSHNVSFRVAPIGAYTHAPPV